MSDETQAERLEALRSQRAQDEISLNRYLYGLAVLGLERDQEALAKLNEVQGLQGGLLAKLNTTAFAPTERDRDIQLQTIEALRHLARGQAEQTAALAGLQQQLTLLAQQVEGFGALAKVGTVLEQLETQGAPAPLELFAEEMPAGAELVSMGAGNGSQ